MYAVDENGMKCIEDYILYVLGSILKEQHCLQNNTVASHRVPTWIVQSDEAGGVLRYVTTVGDNNNEAMALPNGYVLGESAVRAYHLVSMRRPGDGILTALMLME